MVFMPLSLWGGNYQRSTAEKVFFGAYSQCYLVEVAGESGGKVGRLKEMDKRLN